MAKKLSENMIENMRKVQKGTKWNKTPPVKPSRHECPGSSPESRQMAVQTYRVDVALKEK